jgi:hypothetical protein
MNVPTLLYADDIEQGVDRGFAASWGWQQNNGKGKSVAMAGTRFAFPLIAM